MKKWIGKILLVLAICGVLVASALIGILYSNFITEQINDDSTDHLEEIYGQVNRSFSNYIYRNWGILDTWNDFIRLAGDENSDYVSDFFAKKQAYWGFSEFYLISKDGKAVTINGTEATLVLENMWDTLIDQQEPILVGETLPSGQEGTIFAIPVSHTSYQGFSYDAVAVSYTNEALSSSLKVNAFSGESKCFVIHNDGRVLLSTQAGGTVFANYLSYLKGASGLDEESLETMHSNWQNEVSGIIQCEIGNVDYCIYYQPLGYQDYVLLGIVPQSIISAGFLTVQKVTMRVLSAIFLIISIMIITLLILRSRSLSQKNRMELQYRERMFDVLSNNVDDIFIMLDTNNQHVDYISPNIERLLGISIEDARENIRVMEKCAVNYNVVVLKEELEAIPLNENKYWECEYMHQTTGERRWYRMTIYHMSIQNVEKFIVVLSDRTLEQQMNQKLQEALTAAKSANEAKSNFLSNMSHDIRTPMNAIVGFLVLLEKDADNEEKVREYTHKIMASSQHLLSLINDVLDMSKIESGKTSLNVDHFSLPELLEDLNIILLPQAKAKKQSFKIHVQGAPPEQIIGDKLRLNQILINLLSNAIKYTPVGGKIEFLISELEASTPQYVKLQFVVKDNGIGMSEEFQKTVFAPFSREISSVTNKVQGTGLGMAITKNLVDLMGGIIQVESKPDQGTVFTVELSFMLPDPDAEDEWFRQRITRVLVADDDAEICKDIQEMMHDTGVDVSCVTDGKTAVEKAVRAHKEGNDFDVILLDWKMPEMSGVDTARAIREQVKKDTPILVLTSYDWAEIEEEARNAGINAFMSKPFFVSTFWQTLKPLFCDTEEQDLQETASTEEALSGRLFLVAEDNELNAEILTEILNMENAECEVAANGEEAVEMFTGSEPGHYDMILMDVQMPIMNGYEATRAIRASGHPEAKTIPIVAMTANTFAEDVRNALDAGMNDHLAKPIDMHAVRETVGKLLKEKEKSEGGRNQ